MQVAPNFLHWPLNVESYRPIGPHQIVGFCALLTHLKCIKILNTSFGHSELSYIKLHCIIYKYIAHTILSLYFTKNIATACMHIKMLLLDPTVNDNISYL